MTVETATPANDNQCPVAARLSELVQTYLHILIAAPTIDAEIASQLAALDREHDWLEQSMSYPQYARCHHQLETLAALKHSAKRLHAFAKYPP